MTDDWDRVNTGTPDPSFLAHAEIVAREYEPLITKADYDNPLNPQTLYLHFSTGLIGDTGRFDVTWTKKNYYRYHYSETADFNYRYDYHPRDDLPDAHFHPPPDASHENAVPSCIVVSSVRLVTLAVLQLWRDAFETGDLTRLQRENPP